MSCQHCGPGQPAMPGSSLCFDCATTPLSEVEALVPSLRKAADALRLEAMLCVNGLDRLHLESLANTLDCERRIQGKLLVRVHDEFFSV